jgi:hypothetical protein
LFVALCLCENWSFVCCFSLVKKLIFCIRRKKIH